MYERGWNVTNTNGAINNRRNNMKKCISTLAIMFGLAVATATYGVVIDYTGGSGTGWLNHYEENGFQVDVIGDTAFFGDYYGAGNDVIHAHWLSGGIGSVTSIQYTKIGGGTFDLNYFILTSNTQQGGGPATGNERAFITHDGGLDPILLPKEDWGFPATQIFLPSTYDHIASFQFHVENAVACFGMDEFYIDEAPPGVPDGGSSIALLGLGLTALAGLRRRMS
jgi:VPDSG-CTERM motif